jgi:hypothetical protein
MSNSKDNFSIKLTTFDGNPESWDFWKTKTLGAFITNDNIYELITSDNSNVAMPPSPARRRASVAKGPRLVKPEEIAAEGNQTERISALESYVTTLNESKLQNEDQLVDDRPPKSEYEISKAKRIMYGAIVGCLTEPAMKYLDGVTPGDGLSLWTNLVKAFEKTNPLNRVALLINLFNRGYEDTDEDFMAYLARFNALATRIKNARPDKEPIADDIKQALLMLGVSSRDEHAQDG